MDVIGGGGGGGMSTGFDSTSSDRRRHGQRRWRHAQNHRGRSALFSKPNQTTPCPNRLATQTIPTSSMRAPTMPPSVDTAMMVAFVGILLGFYW
jgi:hypothetical protein